MTDESQEPLECYAMHSHAERPGYPEEKSHAHHVNYGGHGEHGSDIPIITWSEMVNLGKKDG